MDQFSSITDPINKLDLEFLMNRSQFKKYVAMVDPTKHMENEAKLKKIRKYKHRILGLTDELVENPEMMVALDVNESFFQYVNVLIRYFETKDMEKHDMDVLFDKIDDDGDDDGDDDDTITLKEALLINKPPRELAEDTLEDTPVVKSFWSRDRVVKQSSILDYPLRKRK